MAGVDSALVSVVIPTYYRNELLADAVQSVREQSHAETEIIVVDGSGEANAAPVVDDASDVEYVPLDEDPGVQSARSIGTERASGAYVQFLDDDDRLRADKFERQLPLFSESVGVVYSAIRIHETGHVKRPDPDHRGDVFEQAIRARLHEPAVTGSLLIDRGVLAEALPLEHNHGCDDDGLMLDLAMRTEFDYVDEPLVELRKDTEHSLSSLDAYIEGRKRLLEEYAHLYERTSGDPRSDVLHDVYRATARRALRQHSWSWRAVTANARAAYYASGARSRAKSVGACLASLFGQQGYLTIRRLYRRVS